VNWRWYATSRVVIIRLFFNARFKFEDKFFRHFAADTSVDLTDRNFIVDDALEHFTNLQTLTLRTNTSITDEGIRHLTTLTCLDLEYNRAITIDGIVALTNLTSLALGKHRLRFDASQFPSLRSLDLNSNRII
jgi:hypothetical protein